MEQQSSASALAARTAGMTDEQILDLDIEALEIGNGSAPLGASTRGDFDDVWETPGAAATSGGAGAQATGAGPTSLTPERAVAPTAFPGSTNGAAARDTRAANAGVEPAWLKQLEAQPGAAAEARQWREAAKDVAALDAAYFSGNPGSRSGLAARLYESDPGAFREMLAESTRMLAARDPQALADLARQLDMSEAQAPNAAAKSLTQAVRTPEPGAAAHRRRHLPRIARDAFRRSRARPASGRNPARLAFRRRYQAAGRVADLRSRSHGDPGSGATRRGGMDFLGARIRPRPRGARGRGGLASRHHRRTTAGGGSGERAASSGYRLQAHER